MRVILRLGTVTHLFTRKAISLHGSAILLVTTERKNQNHEATLERRDFGEN